MSRKITLGMGARGPGRGGNQITLGFGSSLFRALREVLRLLSRIRLKNRFGSDGDTIALESVTEKELDIASEASTVMEIETVVEEMILNLNSAPSPVLSLESKLVLEEV